MRTEIRMAAFGGQGIILAGVILGDAVVRDGKNAVQSQSYGPESRGGAARSEVIISDRRIHYPRVIDADYFAALSQPGYEKYQEELKPGAVVIVDMDLVTAGDNPKAGAFYRLPFTRTAEELGGRIVTNIAMLGSLCAITGVVTADSLAGAVRDHVPARFADMNLRAFEMGFELGRQAMAESGSKG